MGQLSSNGQEVLQLFKQLCELGPIVEDLIFLLIHFPECRGKVLAWADQNGASVQDMLAFHDIMEKPNLASGMVLLHIGGVGFDWKAKDRTEKQQKAAIAIRLKLTLLLSPDSVTA